MASSHWGKIFRWANGLPIVGKGNLYFKLKGATGSTAEGQTVNLVESTTRKGYYYGEVTVIGRYNIEIDGTIDTQLSGANGIAIFCVA